MCRVRILIVDDQAAFRDSVRDLFEGRGHVVADGSNGEEAREAIASFGPDLLLLDVRLGRESGLDVARALTASWPELAVVLISIDSRTSLDDARAAGARGFIPKQQLQAADLAAFLEPTEGS
jgi:DNA-binding NarL/FixJ family response regulator